MRQKFHKMKEQPTRWVLGHKITPHRTTGDYNLVTGESPAGAQGPPPHIHRLYEEVFFVIQGELDFMLDGNLRTVRAGEMINIPSGSLHTFVNSSDQPCTWLNIHSPNGFQSFFDTFGIPENEAEAFQRSLDPGRIESVLKRAREFDLEIVLPEGVAPS